MSEIAKANKGWTLTKLAEVLEVDPQTVYYWNQGRAYPRSLAMLLRLCGLLDCTVEELVG